MAASTTGSHIGIVESDIANICFTVVFGQKVDVRQSGCRVVLHGAISMTHDRSDLLKFALAGVAPNDAVLDFVRRVLLVVNSTIVFQTFVFYDGAVEKV